MPAGNNGLAETMLLSTLELSHEICKNKHCTWSMAIQQYKAVWLLTGYPNKDIDKIEKQSIVDSSDGRASARQFTGRRCKDPTQANSSQAFFL